MFNFTPINGSIHTLSEFFFIAMKMKFVENSLIDVWVIQSREVKALLDFFLVCTYMGCVCLGSVLIIYLSDLSSCLVCKPFCLHYLQYHSHNTPPLIIPSSPIFSSFLPPSPQMSFIRHADPLTPFPFPPSLFFSISMVLWCIHD